MHDSIDSSYRECGNCDSNQIRMFALIKCRVLDSVAFSFEGPAVFVAAASQDRSGTLVGLLADHAGTCLVFFPGSLRWLS